MALHEEKKLFIGGEWVDPIDGGLIESIDPANGRCWAMAAVGGARDMDRAVASAQEAMAGPWRKLPVWERAAILRRFAEAYLRRTEQLATIESRDTGRPIRDTRPEFPGHAQIWWWNASLADKLGGGGQFP